MATMQLVRAETQRLRKQLEQQEQELVACGQPRAVTEAAIGHIRATRTALSAEPADVLTAADQLLALKCLMRRVATSEEVEKTRAPELWWYLIAWLVALVLFGVEWHIFLRSWLRGSEIWHELAYCMVAGGIGGVLQSVFGLHRHLAAKDFERGAVHLYYAKPVMGVILGPVAFLFLKIGLLAISGSGAGGAVQNLEFAVVVAFLAGYSERFWAELIDRMLETLLRPSTRSEPQAAAGPTAPSPTAPPRPVEPDDADYEDEDGEDGEGDAPRGDEAEDDETREEDEEEPDTG